MKYTKYTLILILLTIFLFPLTWLIEVKAQSETNTTQVSENNGVSLQPIDLSHLAGSYEFSFRKKKDGLEKAEPSSIIVMDETGSFSMYVPPENPIKEMTCSGQATTLQRTLTLEIRCGYVSYIFTYEIDFTDVRESDDILLAPSSTSTTLSSSGQIIEEYPEFVKLKKTTFDPVSHFQDNTKTFEAKLTQTLKEWKEEGANLQPLQRSALVGTYKFQKKNQSETEDTKSFSSNMQIKEDGSISLYPPNLSDQEKITCHNNETPFIINNRVVTFNMKCDHVDYIMTFHINFNEVTEFGETFQAPALMALVANSKIIMLDPESTIEFIRVPPESINP